MIRETPSLRAGGGFIKSTAKNEIKTQMYKRLIFPISIFLLLGLFVSGVQAQGVANAGKATPSSVSTPEQIQDGGVETSVDRLNQLDEKLNPIIPREF